LLRFVEERGTNRYKIVYSEFALGCVSQLTGSPAWQ